MPFLRQSDRLLRRLRPALRQRGLCLLLLGAYAVVVALTAVQHAQHEEAQPLGFVAASHRADPTARSYSHAAWRGAQARNQQSLSFIPRRAAAALKEEADEEPEDEAPDQRVLEETCEVVVAGGGIGGLTTALRLAQLPWTRPTRILLVDAKERYVFQPLLVDYAVSDVIDLEDLAPQYESLVKFALRERAPAPPLTYHAELEFLQANISKVDNSESKVEAILPSGQQIDISYRTMVLSPGLRQDITVPGQVASPIAQRFSTLEDAEALRDRLAKLNTSEKVLVVGGNYVGVELAASLAEVGWNVTLFAGSGVLARSSDEARKAAEERLEELDVEVRLQRVTEVLPDGVRWQGSSASRRNATGSTEAEGIVHGSVVLISGAGRGPPAGMSIDSEEAQSPCPVSVDKRLQAAPGVFCLGDAARSGAPATGQTAIAQAEVAAWNVFAEQTGLPTSVWREVGNDAPLGEFVALGKEDAIGSVNAWRMPAIIPSALPGLSAQLVAPFTELAARVGPKVTVNLTSERWSAAAVRRLAYLYRLPTTGHRLKVAARWARRLADRQEAMIGSRAP